MTGWLDGLEAVLVALVAAALLEVLVSRAVRAVLLSFKPLSGEQTDSVHYSRSIFTPGSRDAALVWLGLVLTALGAAGAWVGSGTWAWLALLGFALALGWDLWTWERVAVSTRTVSWRRGWRHSTRQLPISRVTDVHLVEKRLADNLGPLAQPLGTCYVALQLRDGGVAKLPRSGILASRSRVEDVANFVRMQLAIVQEERERSKNDKRREKIAELDPVDIAIRMRLRALSAKDEQAPSAQ